MVGRRSGEISDVLSVLHPPLSAHHLRAYNSKARPFTTRWAKYGPNGFQRDCARLQECVSWWRWLRLLPGRGFTRETPTADVPDVQMTL